MKKSTFYSLAVAILCFASCGGDEEIVDPNHIGVWSLDSYVFLNVPDDYDNNEGSIFALSDINFGSSPIDEYTLSIARGGTYARAIDGLGPAISDDGTWTLEDGRFSLDSDVDGGDVEWSVEKNEDNQLWLSQSTRFNLLKNAITDTATTEWLSSLSLEQRETFTDQVTLDFTFVFDK